MEEENSMNKKKIDDVKYEFEQIMNCINKAKNNGYANENELLLTYF